MAGKSSQKDKQKNRAQGTGVASLLVDRIFTRRDSMILLIFVLLLAVLMVRLCTLTVVDANALSEEGSKVRTATYKLTARRGTIYDRNGNVLATSVDATTIYADPTKVVDPKETAEVLHEVLGGESEEYLKKLTNPPDPTFVYIAQRADPQLEQDLRDANQEYIDAEVERLRSLGNDIPAEIITPLTGIDYLQDTRREYPKESIGAQIIGTVDGEGNGVSGLEQTYDSILRGIDGKRVVEEAKQISENADPLPMIDSIVEEVQPVAGSDIIISIDIETQQFLELNLQAHALKYKTNNASAMLLDGTTGEIIATASIPLFDRENVTDEDIANGATNVKAITMPFEPGSTFKLCVAGAALDLGIANAESTYFCPANLEIYDYTVKDFNDRGDMTMNLRQIMANSSNVGVSLLEQQMGDAVFHEYLVKLGLGQYTHVDYPAESRGALAPVEEWTPIQASNISFGQGLEVTNVQMASIYGAVANDGVLIEPHFLISRPQYDEEITYDSRRVYNAQTARDLEDLLRAVVTEGTGTAAAIDGYDVVGKTGTAEKSNLVGGYEASLGESIYSFAGYLDNTNSNYVFVCSFDNPTGFSTAPSTTFFPLVMKFVANRYVIEPKVEGEAVNVEDIVATPVPSAEAASLQNSGSEEEEPGTDGGAEAADATASRITAPVPRAGQDWIIDTSG